jgi:hypothetical protein
VYQATSVEPTECRSRGHRKAEELSDLHGPEVEPIERDASRELDEQRRLTMRANEFNGPQGPRRVEVILEFVFVYQTTVALMRRIFGPCARWHEGISVAVDIVASKSAEDALGVLPEHFR